MSSNNMYEWAARRVYGPTRPVTVRKNYLDMEPVKIYPALEVESLYEAVGAGRWDDRGYFCEPVIAEFMAVPSEAERKAIELGGVRARAIAERRAGA